MMNLNNRVSRLLDEARGRERARRRKGTTRLLKGLEYEAVLNAVEAALDDADADLVESILGFVEKAAQTLREPPPQGSDNWYEGCEKEFETHFFVYWLWGLSEGSWALPTPMPRSLLEGFNSRYGCVLWRCEDCLTGLGNGSRYATCPVCGSENLSQKKLYGPTGDRHWEYTPLPAPR